MTKKRLHNFDKSIIKENSIICLLRDVGKYEFSGGQALYERAIENCEEIVKTIPVEQQAMYLSEIHHFLLDTGAKILAGKKSSILKPRKYTPNENVMSILEEDQNNGGAVILSSTEENLIPEYENTEKIASLLEVKNGIITGKIKRYIGVSEKVYYYKKFFNSLDVILGSIFDSILAHEAHKSGGRIFVTDKAGDGGILLMENLEKNDITYDVI
jgi:hypothetical protein